MRYENWDVLLFPANCKVPVQEFKTQCFVTRDRDSPYLHNPAFAGPAAYYQPHGNFSQLPVLTTFIPSLPLNSPFRVSIHTWEQPRSSRLMESLLQPDDTALFEVRIFIDGLCVAGSVIGQRTNWPHVIDLSSHVDKSGNQDTLRFPPFHQEILEQRHWDAGDLHGRIRIVIAEGFARPHRNPPFERVKEIIAFAFQHAPLNVLEYSSIAWPNASMWSKEPRLFKYNTGSGVSDLKEADDAHGHSPSRPEARPPVATAGPVGNPTTLNLWRDRNYQGPVPQWQGSNYREPRWAPAETVFADPFIDPYVLDPAARHRGARPSWEDISMPDYVSSSNTSSRAISSMTGISYEHSKHPSLVAPIDEESYSQLIQALSPPKPLSCISQPQSNTPAALALPVKTKLSAAAEARSASYGKSGSRASVSIPKDVSYSGSREASGSSTKSSPMPADAAVERGTVGRVHPSPSGPVKGRKEGLSQENKENEAETPRKESDKAPPKLIASPIEGKRRRSLGSSREDCLNINRKEPAVLVSPTQDSPRVEDVVDHADFDCFLDSQPTLVGATADAGETE
ncbi:hypothetical protein ASPCAL09920 [Aspergillus calidoustus]|uniref:Uncharacterized protein n=1 Tax=Aspergillus calidoustus TaxID=454130 RepID=A0A0U5CBJ6_ASPCI|nr:hypothetical protein ASPCAL09920 [Aspergillus calidoustus]